LYNYLDSESNEIQISLKINKIINILLKPFDHKKHIELPFEDLEAPINKIVYTLEYIKDHVYSKVDIDFNGEIQWEAEENEQIELDNITDYFSKDLVQWYNREVEHIENYEDVTLKDKKDYLTQIINGQDILDEKVGNLFWWWGFKDSYIDKAGSMDRLDLTYLFIYFQQYKDKKRLP
jgi:hypothetical protein